MGLVLVTALAGCGTPKPYERVRGQPMVTATQMDASLKDNGFRIVLAAQCQRRITEVWCSANSTCSTPPTFRDEAIACPGELAFAHTKVSIRAPWGGVYGATADAAGIAEVPVDWAATELDPLAEGVVERLARGWMVLTDKTQPIPMQIHPEDVERMRAAIGAATDTQYEVGAVNDKATLSAELSERPPLTFGRAEVISLVVTNKGPQPAYRVIAKLRSGVGALHGHQLSFGRIDPGKSKIRRRVLSMPQKLEDRSAMVVADVSYFNGDPIEARKRFALAAEVGPESKRTAAPLGVTLDCKRGAAEVGPGGRARITCELRNLGSELINGLDVAVSVGGVASKNDAPKSLEGTKAVKLELVGLTPASSQHGAEVPVIVRVSAPGIPAVERKLAIRIAALAMKCMKGQITRVEYKVKRRQLEDLL